MSDMTINGQIKRGETGDTVGLKIRFAVRSVALGSFMLSGDAQQMRRQIAEYVQDDLFLDREDLKDSFGVLINDPPTQQDQQHITAVRVKILSELTVHAEPLIDQYQATVQQEAS